MDKRRKELALIGVGALVVLVALFLTFRPRTRPAAAQAPAAATQPAQPEAKAHSQAAQPGEAESAVIESGAATSAARDPFRPIVLAQAPTAPPPGTPAAPMPGLPPLPVVGFLGAAPTSPAGMAPAAPESLRLAGVVEGNPSVAVLRRGAKRFIVTIGDPVDNQYVVKSISDGRVVLASGERTLSLTLGGRM